MDGCLLAASAGSFSFFFLARALQHAPSAVCFVFFSNEIWLHRESEYRIDYIRRKINRSIGFIILKMTDFYYRDDLLILCSC
jgi:hypothetical protein